MGVIKQDAIQDLALKMKPFIFVKLNKAKEKIIAVLFVCVTLCRVVPIISWVNEPILVLGMPF